MSLSGPSLRLSRALTAARQRGRVGGRTPALSDERGAEVTHMRDQKGRGIAELARLFQVSTSTIGRA
jgi:DNA invertase Pin-like site-specific DNA recombinase